MRYIFAIGGVVLAIVVVGALCSILVFGGFASGVANYMDKRDAATIARQDTLDARQDDRRQEKISVARSVNADKFDAKRIDETIKKKSNTKENAFAELSELIVSKKASRLKMKVWRRGMEDEDLERIESFADQCAGTVAALELRLEKLHAEQNASESELEVLSILSSRLAKKRFEMDGKIEDFRARMSMCLAEHKKIRTEYEGTPAFRRRAVEKKLNDSSAKIKKIQENAQKLKTEDDALARRQELCALKEKAENEKRAAIVSEIEKVESDIAVCREILGKAKTCLAATRDISALKAQRLDIEESAEDKNIDLQY